MDTYVTGSTIKRLREKKGLTQTELATQLCVSSKAVSKWETARGLPDISLLESLARVLGVSVTELMSGDTVINRNRSCNMLRCKLHVCPICGNIIPATGEAVITCCGLTLPPLEAETPDEEHRICMEAVEDEHYITLSHPMRKEHYISFLAFVSSDRLQVAKLYPEGDAQARLQLRGGGVLYWYCNRHGLMKQKV